MLTRLFTSVGFVMTHQRFVILVAALVMLVLATFGIVDAGAASGAGSSCGGC